MRTGSLDNLPVGLDQCVRLTGERSNFFREFSGQTLGIAGSNGSKPIGNALERR
jgi:hypothetical protein